MGEWVKANGSAGGNEAEWEMVILEITLSSYFVTFFADKPLPVLFYKLRLEYRRPLFFLFFFFTNHILCINILGSMVTQHGLGLHLPPKRNVFHVC